MTSRPTPFIVGFVIVWAFLLSDGCDDAAGPASAGKQQVTVYTALETDQVPALLERFRKAHPDIEVKVVRDSTGIITARLLAESADPKADVIWGVAATSLLVADQRELLEPFAPSNLARIAPQFRDSRDPPHWVGASVFMTAFAVNTVELERRKLAVPRAFDDLVKPDYRGLITMPNPASSGTGFLTLVGILQSRGEEQGWGYLDRLHENIAQYTHSGSKPAVQAATGEYPIGIALDFRSVTEKRKGAPLEVVFPAEKSGWDLETTALVRKAKPNPAARTFADWATSPDAFEQYGKHAAVLAQQGKSGAAPLPDYPADPAGQLAPIDLAKAAVRRDTILAEWTRRYAGKSEPKS